MENGKQAHHSMSMPLVSRLDHLESMMKDLESKQNMAKWGSNYNTSKRQRQYLPLNLAVREAYFKGSLLDRVASLESRLFQLCLELESSTSTGDASSSQLRSKKEPSCSIPTFSNNQDQAQKHEACPEVLVNSSEIQGKHSKKVQQRRKQASPIKQRVKSEANKDEKTCNSGKKKKVSSIWPHLKILGC